MLRGEKTKKEKELSVEKTSITRPGPAQLTHWIHFPNNHFLFFLFFFLDLNFGEPFSHLSKLKSYYYYTILCQFLWRGRRMSGHGPVATASEKKNDRKKEKKMKNFFFSTISSAVTIGISGSSCQALEYFFFKSTGCPGAVLSGTQSSRPSLTLQFAGHNHHQNGKEKIKEKKKKK